ncbi:MAG: S41 family peptidase, partial [Bacteroidia bacterium]|nr:S41 family peptidase [Bacteroidia bacterium]
RKMLFMKNINRVGQVKEYNSATYHYLEPMGPQQYKGPVILLQNVYSASGSEAFALAMRVLPYATSIGETTEGCFANFYPHKLINGWTVTMPWSYAVDQNDFCWEGIGVPPDLRKINTKEDIEAGNDKVLEFAMEILKAGGNIRKEADGSLKEMKTSLVDQFVVTSAKDGFVSAVNQYNKSRKKNSEGFYISIQELAVNVRVLLQAERNEDAFALLELGLKEFPNDANTLYFLARLYENFKKQPELAKPIWEKLSKLSTSLPWETNLVAEAKKSLGSGN